MWSKNIVWVQKILCRINWQKGNLYWNMRMGNRYSTVGRSVVRKMLSFILFRHFTRCSTVCTSIFAHTSFQAIQNYTNYPKDMISKHALALFWIAYEKMNYSRDKTMTATGRTKCFVNGLCLRSIYWMNKCNQAILNQLQ